MRMNNKYFNKLRRFFSAWWYGEKPIVVWLPAGIFPPVRHEIWRELRLREIEKVEGAAKYVAPMIKTDIETFKKAYPDHVSE